MSATNISALKNRHRGEEIHVVGSGASLNYVNLPVFFAHKIVVTINEMFRHVQPTYALAHHYEHLQEAIDAGHVVVTSSIDLGLPGWGNPPRFRGDYFTYDAKRYDMSLDPSIDVEALKADTTTSLVTSCCTASEALQFAAHLGARSIVCCGLDGGALDGKWCLDGYNEGASTNPQHVRLTQRIVQQTIDAIRKKGVSVGSYNPLVGCELEGHRYETAPALRGQALIQAIQTTNWEVPVTC